MKREKPWLRGNLTKALYKPNGKWTPSDIAPHSAIHAHSCILWTHQRGTLARRHEQQGIEPPIFQLEAVLFYFLSCCRPTIPCD